MVKVLPVPALASSTVMPDGSGPQTSNGARRRSQSVSVLDAEQPVPEPRASGRAASARRRPTPAPPRRAAAVGAELRRTAALLAEDEHVVGVAVLAVEATRP